MREFHYINPGDNIGIRPDADFHNATVDAINGTRDLMKSKGGLDRPAIDPATVLVKNETGADLDAFSVVKLDETLYNRATAEFYKMGLNYGVEVKAHKPSGNTNEIIGITCGAIPAGKVGRATVSGATLVKYTGNAGAFLKSVNNNVQEMARGDEGQGRIIATSNATSSGGDAYVLLNPSNGSGGGCTCDGGVFACLDEDLEAEGYTTGKVWPDFEEEIEILASPLMCGEDLIEKCTMVYCQQIGGDYYALIEGGKCNCNCEPYPDGYSVYANILTDEYLLGESGCNGEYFCYPTRLTITGYKNDDRPNTTDTKSKHWLGVIATYNDYNTCLAALNALDKNAQLITDTIPQNNMGWFEDFINAGFRAGPIANDAQMMTVADVKSCQPMIEYEACNYNCSQCAPVTCSECNQQLQMGVLHALMEVYVRIVHNNTLYTLKQFTVCRDYPLGTIQNPGNCCKNSSCFD